MESEVSTPLGRPPSNWKISKLGDITTHVNSGATPRGGANVYCGRRVNYALVRSQNVLDRTFDETDLAFISDGDAQRLAGAEIDVDDVLLNITGDGVTFSRSCLVPPRILPACVNQHVMRIRCDRSICLPGYLVSYLTHPEIKDYIETFNAGGSRRAITKGHIQSFIIPLPPLKEQRQIANILGTLDDKIELNRRMNETLEGMARAIFKSWFVDFDPVRAKADGRQPAGMDAATADLFPDSFEDSPLGKIPKGWRVGSIRQLCERIENGGTPKRDVSENWDLREFRWLTSGEVRQGFISRTENFISRVGLEASSAKIWPEWTTVVALYGATAGYASLLGIELCANQACCALVPTDYASSFNYLVASDSLSIFQQQARGSAQQNLSQTIVADLKTIVPPPMILAAFESVVHPMLRSCVSGLLESQELAFVRDALLPKLLSGEIRVPEAEKIVEDAR